MSKIKLTDAFAQSIKPQQKLSIVDWADKYVKLNRSSRSDKADLKQTPWLIQPLETIIGNTASEVVVLAPTGSGKSTMLEIAGTYIVSEKPGPTMFAAQTDPDAQEFFQTGLMPALRNCSSIDKLWPSQKNFIRKDFVQFAHMPLWVCGSNMSNFQSKSLDNVFLDEAWMLKPSLMTEAKRRTHDRFGSKVTLVSQAGIVGDDLDNSFNQTYQHEFAYKCPNCNEYHRYNFENLKWNCEKVDDIVIWESIEAYYECPCGHTFKDTVNDRRAMAESGQYVPGDSINPLKGHIGYHYTILNVWWVEWSKIITEFLKANQEAKKGNLKYLRQFNQKRLAKPWNEYEFFEDDQLNLGAYFLAEAAKWEVTLISADVQKQDIWYVVRTWSRSGESRLLESGKVLSFADLKKVQDKWEVLNNCVFVDSAYRTEEVKLILARNNWLGLNGRPDASYTIFDKRKAKSFKRLFSIPNIHATSSGNAIITYYSSNGIKDVLFILKAGHGARWEVAQDCGTEYINQLNSEVKTVGVNGQPLYKKVKVNNHLLDCEAMNLAAALMHKVFPDITLDE
jgi:hypothetical protein